MSTFQQQMTLEVGGEELDDMKPTGSYSVSGKLNAAVELPKGADVRVSVTDADGQIVATGLGFIGAITFRQHESKDGLRWTERQHKARLR